MYDASGYPPNICIKGCASDESDCFINVLVDDLAEEILKAGFRKKNGTKKKSV